MENTVRANALSTAQNHTTPADIVVLPRLPLAGELFYRSKESVTGSAGRQLPSILRASGVVFNGQGDGCDQLPDCPEMIEMEIVKGDVSCIGSDCVALAPQQLFKNYQRHKPAP